MAGYANQHSNTQSNRVGYKSDGRISGYSAGLYATWYQNDANKTGAYVDSWALYNWFDNSVSSDIMSTTIMTANDWILPWFILVRIMYIMLNHV
ncbi:autotransporter outer membrane beta-barrel domain-containing protein [Escherichia coli]|nr:autotransporter outer membrane beta-barrel domain-containing protein [Escherichia coli]EFI6963990.1 autotransporter outer membrane beta-barrel domain-containing protein [Escherichia coli]KYV61581.1 hypothetical protein AMK82_18090 [Escherichia coli]KYW45301.1 hypothetical protein AMK96_07065 [Escherichia coli]TJF37736.1 autotransporter outer membrane beta-barrel domain-containing protein [Escherichia coli]